MPKNRKQMEGVLTRSFVRSSSLKKRTSGEVKKRETLEEGVVVDSRGGGNKGSILVFDDPEVYSNLWTPFSEQLTREGYQVDFVENLSMAKGYFGLSIPALLICDFYDNNRNVMRDKIDFLKGVSDSEVPVIVVHELSAGVLRRTGIDKYSFDAVYYKPSLASDPSELCAKARELVGGS